VAACVSGAIRMVSTMPGLNDQMEEDTQYLLTLLGQIVVGIANPLAFSLPTKVQMNL